MRATHRCVHDALHLNSLLRNNICAQHNILAHKSVRLLPGNAPTREEHVGGDRKQGTGSVLPDDHSTLEKVETLLLILHLIVCLASLIPTKLSTIFIFRMEHVFRLQFVHMTI